MQRLVASILLLGAALLCATAAAHDLPAERKIVVDVGASSVEMMLVSQHPKSDAVMLLMKKYDVDGDGELTGGEADLAGREWMPRMLHGLQFEVEGERPKGQKPEIKFRREDDGALSAAAYIKWELDALEPGESRTFYTRVLDKDGATRTLVELRTADGLESPTEVERMLAPGEEASLTARSPSEDDGR